MTTSTNALAIRANDFVGMVEVDEAGEASFGGTALAEIDTMDLIAMRAQALQIVLTLKTFVTGIQNTIAAEMEQTKATALFHPDYEIAYETEKGADVINGELLFKELTALANAGKCDPVIVDKAVRRVESVEYKTHATYLKKLRAFGAEVARVLDAGIRPGEDGPPKLSIKAKK